MVPSVGVTLSEGDRHKDGGINFHNKFGKTSLKDYEKIKAMYVTNVHNNNTEAKGNDNYVFKYTNNSVPHNNDLNITKIANKDFFHNTKNDNSSFTNWENGTINKMINNLEQEFKFNDNSRPLNSNSSICDKIKIDPNFWKDDVGNANVYEYDKLIVNNTRNSSNGILNENIFKNRRTIDLREENKFDEINNFNLKIMRNNNWGHVDKISTGGKLTSTQNLNSKSSTIRSTGKPKNEKIIRTRTKVI
jgi:hypothetical protein